MPASICVCTWILSLSGSALNASSWLDVIGGVLLCYGLSLAIAYAMAENCVAVGPIPNTWEQDIYVQLKQKKKNAEDPIDGVDEAFARGMPESDFMFKPYRATTGIADPYKEMTPW